MIARPVPSRAEPNSVKKTHKGKNAITPAITQAENHARPGMPVDSPVSVPSGSSPHAAILRMPGIAANANVMISASMGHACQKRKPIGRA
ncbi:hypothetical protein B7486_00205 [cyanobacterium TDX16]|nr:hypothetical protein B7486_00205 [cyanobacterium TDX16]